MGRNLGPLNIKDSYEGLVQISGSNQLTDGSGSVIASVEINASTATSASYATTANSAVSASYALTASYASNVPATASFAISASHANNADSSISASYALTSTSASHAVNADLAITASYALNVTPINTGSFYLSSSVNNATITFTQGDGSTEAATVNNVSNAISASYAVTASYALDSAPQVSASYATSASHAVASDTSISASYATTASFALNVSTPNLQQVTDAGATTTNAITASGMFVNGDAVISGDLDVNGTITYISSSTLQIGDNVIEINYNKAAGNSGILTYDTTSPFTASLLWDATNDRWIAGPYGSEETIILAGDTGSMSVANAVSSSYALSASYAPAAATPTLQQVLTEGNTADTNIVLTNSTDNEMIIRGDGEKIEFSSLSNANELGFTFVDNSFAQDAQILFDPSTAELKLTGGGGVKISTIKYPTSDGTTGQVITTDGASTLSFTSTVPSASYALTASYVEGGVDPFPYTGNVGITGDINLTGSYNRLSGSFSGSAIDNITDVYSSTAAVEHVISLTQAEYNAVSASADPNTLYYITDAAPASGELAGLITGSGGTNTIISAPHLTTTPAVASAASGIAIGNNARNYAAGSVVIGDDAQNYDAGRPNSVAIGKSAAAAQNATSIGWGANATSDSSVGIGRDSYSNANFSVAIGYDARASDGGVGATSEICIGYGTRTYTTGEINIGSKFLYNSGSNGKINLADDTIVSGSLNVDMTGGNVGLLTSGSLTGTFITNIIPDVAITETQVEKIVTLTQAQYSGLTPIDDTLYIISDATGEVITGGLSITGSVLGEVNALSIAALQADIDCSVGNFFTLTLAAGVDTEIIFSNVQAGQTINLQITNNATTIGTVSFGGGILFADGTAFTATATLDAIDVMTFVCFDGINILATGIKNFTI